MIQNDVSKMAILKGRSQNGHSTIKMTSSKGPFWQAMLSGSWATDTAAHETGLDDAERDLAMAIEASHNFGRAGPADDADSRYPP